MFVQVDPLCFWMRPYSPRGRRGFAAGGGWPQEAGLKAGSGEAGRGGGAPDTLPVWHLMMGWHLPQGPGLADVVQRQHPGIHYRLSAGPEMAPKMLSSSMSNSTAYLIWACHLKDVARRKEGLSVTALVCITGVVSPDGDSTLRIGRRGGGTWGAGPLLPHLVDLLVLLTFSTIQLVTMSHPWGPWILACQRFTMGS